MKMKLSKLKEAIKLEYDRMLEETCECAMAEGEESGLDSQIPSLSSPQEYVQMALLCLDQAGLSLSDQEHIQQVLAKMGHKVGIDGPVVDERSEVSPNKTRDDGKIPQGKSRSARPLRHALGMK